MKADEVIGEMEAVIALQKANILPKWHLTSFYEQVKYAFS